MSDAYRTNARPKAARVPKRFYWTADYERELARRERQRRHYRAILGECFLRGPEELPSGLVLLGALFGMHYLLGCLGVPFSAFAVVLIGSAWLILPLVVVRMRGS